MSVDRDEDGPSSGRRFVVYEDGMYIEIPPEILHARRLGDKWKAEDDAIQNLCELLRDPENPELDYILESDMRDCILSRREAALELATYARRHCFNN